MTGSRLILRKLKFRGHVTRKAVAGLGLLIRLSSLDDGVAEQSKFNLSLTDEWSSNLYFSS